MDATDYLLSGDYRYVAFESNYTKVRKCPIFKTFPTLQCKTSRNSPGGRTMTPVFVFATEMEVFFHLLLLHLRQGSLVSVRTISQQFISSLTDKQKGIFALIQFSPVVPRTFVTPVNLPTVIQYFAWAPKENKYVSLYQPSPNISLISGLLDHARPPLCWIGHQTPQELSAVFVFFRFMFPTTTYFSNQT